MCEDSLIVVPDPLEEIIARAYFDLSRGFLEVSGERLSVLDAVFYQWDGRLSLRQFREFLEQPDAHCLACCERLTQDEIVFRGMGWLNSIQSVGGLKKAEVGFGFVPGGSVFQKLEFGRRMIEWMFDQAGIDILFGTTPVRNRAALAYARRLGFTLHGPIPEFASWRGQLADVWISRLSRKEWSIGRRKQAGQGPAA